MPDKEAYIQKILRENQIFHKSNQDLQRKYIPHTFDMSSHQYIIRDSNIFRSKQSIKGKDTRGKEIIDNEDSFGILIEG